MQCLEDQNLVSGLYIKFRISVFYLYSHPYYLVLSIPRFRTCNNSFLYDMINVRLCVYFCTFISYFKNICNVKNLVLACWFCFLCAFLLFLLFFLLLFPLLFFVVAVSCTHDVFFSTYLTVTERI